VKSFHPSIGDWDLVSVYPEVGRLEMKNFGVFGSTGWNLKLLILENRRNLLKHFRLRNHGTFARHMGIDMQAWRR
jgi:hypothetical protein